jgi:hypothetical protein
VKNWKERPYYDQLTGIKGIERERFCGCCSREDSPLCEILHTAVIRTADSCGTFNRIWGGRVMGSWESSTVSQVLEMWVRLYGGMTYRMACHAVHLFFISLFAGLGPAPLYPPSSRCLHTRLVLLSLPPARLRCTVAQCGARDRFRYSNYRQ